jgi:RNA-directed DNA polymerase
LNPKIRGWSNHFRHPCSKKTFTYVDHQIFLALWLWAKRRHPNKGMKWIQSKYFRSEQLRNWIFYAKGKDKDGNIICLDLIEASKTPIKRHIKMKAEATPYNPIYHDYLDKRILKRMEIDQKSKRQSGWLTWWNLLKPRDKG